MGNKLPVYNMRGKICIVTGANTGIGKATASKLFSYGARVVLACRSVERGQQAIDEIKTQAPNQHPESSMEVIPLDLSDPDTISEFVKVFKSKYPHLDVLINNAGLVKTELAYSKSGQEMTFCVNHLGVFQLTTLLLEYLEKAPTSDNNDTISGPRIVILASEAHKFCQPLEIEHLTNLTEKNFEGVTGPMKVYGRSKLCNLLFALELSKRIKEYGSKITVHSVHPGWVKTELGRDRGSGILVSTINVLEAAVAKSPEDGAIPSLFAACDPTLNNKSDASSVHWVGYNEAWKVEPYALDETAAKKLWDYSEQLIGNKVEKWF